MSLMVRRRAAMAGALASPLLARQGWGQAYPSKQIRMVVPFAAAGTTDLALDDFPGHPVSPT